MKQAEILKLLDDRHRRNGWPTVEESIQARTAGPQRDVYRRSLVEVAEREKSMNSVLKYLGKLTIDKVPVTMICVAFAEEHIGYLPSEVRDAVEILAMEKRITYDDDHDVIFLDHMTLFDMEDLEPSKAVSNQTDIPQITERSVFSAEDLLSSRYRGNDTLSSHY